MALAGASQFMFTIVVVVILVLIAFAVLYVVVRGESTRVRSLEELAGSTQPIDFEAFQNLVTPADTEYLKRELTKAEFRTVQRERLRATAVYVRRIAWNSAILLRIGEAARLHANAEVANAANAMVNSALRVRVLSLAALIKIQALLLIPGLNLDAESVLGWYEKLTDTASLLARLQDPVSAGRVSSTL